MMTLGTLVSVYLCLYRGMGILYGEVTLGTLVSVYLCLYRGVGVLYRPIW